MTIPIWHIWLCQQLASSSGWLLTGINLRGSLTIGAEWSLMRLILISEAISQMYRKDLKLLQEIKQSRIRLSDRSTWKIEKDKETFL